MIVVRKTQGLMHLLPFSRRELADALQCMLEVLGLADCSLELALLGEADMAALNREFLGCEGPTNILSFPVSNEQGQESGAHEAAQELGQLALAPHTVRREAFLYGQDLGEHTLWLLAHGLTHLAGHEHGEIMDSLARMACEAALEQAVMQA